MRLLVCSSVFTPGLLQVCGGFSVMCRETPGRAPDISLYGLCIDWQGDRRFCK